MCLMYEMRRIINELIKSGDTGLFFRRVPRLINYNSIMLFIGLGSHRFTFYIEIISHPFQVGKWFPQLFRIL